MKFGEEGVRSSPIKGEDRCAWDEANLINTLNRPYLFRAPPMGRTAGLGRRLAY